MKCIDAKNWFLRLFVNHCWHYDPIHVTETHGSYYKGVISYNKQHYKCCYCGKERES